MPVADLVFQRTIDLPPVIVWDAFVDPDLLAGWLGTVRVHPTDPPTFDLAWPGTDSRPRTSGTVVSMRPLLGLSVVTEAREIDVSLAEAAGGPRGTSTALTIRLRPGVEAAFAAGLRDRVETRLDWLAGLLHGHPVDWDRLDNTSGDPDRDDRTAHPG